MPQNLSNYMSNEIQAVVNCGAVTGTLQVGETITGGTSTATAVIKRINDSGNNDVASVALNAAGSGYSYGDVLTVAGGTAIQVATVKVTGVATIAAQDETAFDGVGINGSFVGGDGAGGTAYVALNTITLSDGTVITVDAVDANGDVTEFTVTTDSTSGITENNAVLTQSSTTGTGTGFVLTLGIANQDIETIALQDNGEYSVNPTTTANAVTGGTGTGATVDLTMSTGGAVSLEVSNMTDFFDAGETITGGTSLATATVDNTDGFTISATAGGIVKTQVTGDRVRTETLVAMREFDTKQAV